MRQSAGAAALSPEKRDPTDSRAQRAHYRIGEQENQGRSGDNLTFGLSQQSRSLAVPGRHRVRQVPRLWPFYAATRTYR